MYGEKIAKSVIGGIGIIQAALVVLKILGVISWKWVWVLAPGWITVVGLFLLIVYACLWMSGKGGKV